MANFRINDLTAAAALTGAELVEVEQDDSGLKNRKTTAQAIADLAASGSISGLFDITDYGAEGDGTTDDTAAIAAAITAADNAGGGIVWVPAGTFLTDHQDVPQGVDVVGANRTASVLKQRGQTYSSSSDEGGVLNVKGTSVTPIVGVTIANLTVDGNRSGLTVNGSADGLNFECIDLEYAEGCRIVGVRTVDGFSDGVDLDDSNDNLIQDVTATGCGGWGIHVSLRSERNRVVDNVVSGCGAVFDRGGIDQYGSAASESDYARDNTFIGNFASDNYRNYAIESSGATFIGNKSLGTTTQVDVTSGVSDFGGEGEPLPDPVAYQGTPTVDTLRDALVTLGFMLEDPAVWTPADLPGLQVWLEADEISGLSDGDPIATWADLSGNGHDFVQSGADGTRPSYRTGVLNGLPTVRFTAASSQRLRNQDTLTLGAVFFVSQRGSAGIMWGSGPAAAGSTEYIGTPSGSPNDFVFLWDGGSAAGSFVARTSVPAGWAYWEGDTDNVLRRDGSALITGDSPISPPSRADHYLGTRQQLNSFFAGDMALVVITSAKLSASDRAELESYAKNKYDL